MDQSIDPSKITYCRIFPGVGIARLGNSPDEFFIGPETPGVQASPVGGFKDSAGRVKRQAARFRLYAYDDQDQVLGELVPPLAEITWTVHLANSKAAFNTFRGRFWQSQRPNLFKEHPNETPLRNQEILDATQRQELLVIDPGPRSIRPGDGPVELDGGSIGPLPYSDIPPPTDPTKDPLNGSHDGWWNTGGDKMLQPIRMSRKATVPLGTLRVDSNGRLLVLGGYGNSDTLAPDNPIGRLLIHDFYANNDYWYDDTSDGPVTAEVRFNGRPVVVKEQSWVLVVPPKFAPFAEMLTTLYDIAMETWDKHVAGGQLAERRPSFTRNIYPILRRLHDLQWLNNIVYQQHGAGTVYDFGNVDSPLFKVLASNSDTADVVRERNHIFSRLRPPGLVAQTPDAADTPESLEFANFQYMPQLGGDGGDNITAEGRPPRPGGYYITWLTLSERQYNDMKQWAAGNFDADWSGVPAPVPFETLPVTEQPAALDRAALEPCVGGPFFPGIEMTYIATDPATWSGPCRISPATVPGGITCHMALPWQADFSECEDHWWPTARPDDVVSEALLEEVAGSFDTGVEGSFARVLSSRVPWARGIPQDSPDLDNAMVKAWSHFGFVVKREIAGQTVYVETERSPYFGQSERDFFYYLMNIDSYPDFLPRAREMVHEYLAEGRRNMAQADSDEVWRFFPYSPSALENRLELIYANFVRDNETTADPNQEFATKSYLDRTTREKSAYGLLQLGPFNQLDGAWLRRVVPNGPLDEVGERLALIRQDELGDGVTSQNHANVYTDLLKSLNFYLPDIYSRAYANEPRLLDEAFTQPCFILAISQFDDEFLPEILGMTLYLEWSSIGLKSSVSQLEAVGIDPLYYTLHVGIDNVASGHGAVAREAVEIYLDGVRANEGEEAMQRAWERIWAGYVTFGTLGNLGDAIQQHEEQNDNLDDQVQNLIASKAPFASQTHGRKMLGHAAINDWFRDPPGFMNELQRAGLIVPGQPDISPFFQLLSFVGPMFHVFTASEEQLLRDWCLTLGPQHKPPQKTILEGMNYVIDTLRQRQTGQVAHNVRISGPDPDKGRGKRTASIHWWFDKGNKALLAALADPENGWIVPNDSIASPLTSSILSGNSSMAEAFRTVVPDSGGLTCANVLAQWIDAGCPLEEKRPAPALRSVKEVARRPVHRIYHRRDGKIWGMGVPH